MSHRATQEEHDWARELDARTRFAVGGSSKILQPLRLFCDADLDRCPRRWRAKGGTGRPRRAALMFDTKGWKGSRVGFHPRHPPYFGMIQYV